MIGSSTRWNRTAPPGQRKPIILGNATAPVTADLQGTTARYDVSGDRVALVPVNLWNLPKAFRISREAFPDEWRLVWLTYVWHLARAHGVALPVRMVRRRCLQYAFENRPLGRIDILSTRIHDPAVRWVILDTEEAVPGGGFPAFLVDLLPGCRLVLLQAAKRLHFLEEAEAIDHEGYLPGAAGRMLHIYSLRTERVSPGGGHGFSTIPGNSENLDIYSAFHLIYRKGQAIGITGIYATDFWPDIGWGGWGAIRRGSAQLRTVLAAIAATEDLARKTGKEWFCLETSSAPQYHSARRMYEHYGLRQLLCVEDFYRNEGNPQRSESYIVYGKKVLSE